MHNENQFFVRLNQPAAPILNQVTSGEPSSAVAHVIVQANMKHGIGVLSRSSSVPENETVLILHSRGGLESFGEVLRSTPGVVAVGSMDELVASRPTTSPQLAQSQVLAQA